MFSKQLRLQSLTAQHIYFERHQVSTILRDVCLHSSSTSELTTSPTRPQRLEDDLMDECWYQVLKTSNAPGQNQATWQPWVILPGRTGPDLLVRSKTLIDLRYCKYPEARGWRLIVDNLCTRTASHLVLIYRTAWISSSMIALSTILILRAMLVQFIIH
jgi:hypothetical protein